MLFSYAKKKGADYLHGNCAQNFKPLAIFCGCIAQFVLGLVGNPEDRFSHDMAQISAVHFVFSLYNHDTSYF